MKYKREAIPAGTRSTEDLGRAVPTADHPPRNILMGGVCGGSVRDRVMGGRERFPRMQQPGTP